MFSYTAPFSRPVKSGSRAPWSPDTERTTWEKGTTTCTKVLHVFWYGGVFKKNQKINVKRSEASRMCALAPTSPSLEEDFSFSQASGTEEAEVVEDFGATAAWTTTLRWEPKKYISNGGSPTVGIWQCKFNLDYHFTFVLVSRCLQNINVKRSEASRMCALAPTSPSLEEDFSFSQASGTEEAEVVEDFGATAAWTTTMRWEPKKYISNGGSPAVGIWQCKCNLNCHFTFVLVWGCLQQNVLNVNIWVASRTYALAPTSPSLKADFGVFQACGTAAVESVGSWPWNGAHHEVCYVCCDTLCHHDSTTIHVF